MPRPLSFLFVVVLSLAASHDSTARALPPTAPLADPTIIFLHDDAVRTELALTPDQSSALNALLANYNLELLAIRDVGFAGGDPTSQSTLAELRVEVSKLFTEPQRLRLQGLVMQAQGYDHLARSDIAIELKLSEVQQRKIAKISADFHAKAEALHAPNGERPPQELQTELNNLQAARQKQIVAALKPAQLQRWAELLGERFDLGKVASGPAFAPEFPAAEFADTARWLNSPPLSLESLRGQVVVVHFFAFGCSNCQHNYPWYREWQNELTDKGVVLVGIHTPETTAEENIAALQASLDENGLKFPIAVDQQKSMWNAWHNNIWPAVYIIDKRGRLRYWWYGELDWQGAGNQKNARKQIELLLSEPAS